ncbi:transmembrane [Salix suchowensis]|nr:transmembrane [Salix suchowensis]
MRKQRYFGYPVGRIGKSSRRTLKSRGLGRQNFGCHCGANLSRSDESLQGFSFSCHAVFVLLVPFLIGIIQIKFQGTNQSPFQTRLPSMWASVLATFVYCFALAATMKFKCTKYGRFSGHVAFLAGSFSSISTVQFICLWIYQRIIVQFIQFICLWIYQRIMTLIFKILGFWYWILDDMSIQKQPEHPVEIV